MPEYLYRDTKGHEKTLFHRMLYGTGVVCDCGLEMRRVIQPVRINWNGTRAVAETGAAVKELIETRPARLDEYWKEKEAHVKKTQPERANASNDPTYGTVHHERK